jgi:ferredoxin-NADP reductase
MAMLRSLCDEDFGGEIAFIHYARTSQDWLYQPQVEALAATHPNVRATYLATREGGARLGQGGRPEVLTDAAASDGTLVAVCGPPQLIESTRAIFAHVPERVIAETFTPPTLAVTGAAAEGTIRFLNSQTAAPIHAGTLLEQAEAAGLTPEYGCRMGICHTCTCRKAAGAVRNILTGEVSDEEDEDIQLCISVPAGDVALAL